MRRRSIGFMMVWNTRFLCGRFEGASGAAVGRVPYRSSTTGLGVTVANGSERRRTAQQIADALAEGVPAVEAVCLFGSVARGDDDEWSDIDLLVVGTDARVTRRDLVATLPPRLRDTRLSLLYYTADDFDRLRQHDLFVEHFRREGVVLYDRTGRLTDVLADIHTAGTTLTAELERELEKLESYDDLSRFDQNLLFCLSHLYAIGKSVAILELAKDGVFEFNRERAFQALLGRRPEKAREIDAIVRLRPFYELVTRRKPGPLPFSHRDGRREAEEAVGAIKSLAGAPTRDDDERPGQAVAS